MIELWFLWDIFFNFKLGFVEAETGDLVMQLADIRRSYLRSWFALDMASSLPIKFLTLAIPRMASLSFLKVLRLAKLFRLVKLLSCLKELEDLQDSGYVRPSAVRFAKIAFSFIWIVHISSCGYWYYVRSTCNLCNDESAARYGSSCTKDASGDFVVAFTTPSFCPPMSRVGEQGARLEDSW
jgi:hypothetical protein